jgi:hypothetical protein
MSKGTLPGWLSGRLNSYSFTWIFSIIPKKLNDVIITFDSFVASFHDFIVVVVIEVIYDVELVVCVKFILVIIFELW